jgi:Ca-activated chloride channel family protein
VPVGLVAFDGTARALVAPTTDRSALDRAIDRLELGPGTAIGDALYTALDLLPRAGTGETAAAGEGDAVPPPGAPKAGGTVVLLSDGDTTVGRSEDDAARRAAELGVPVSTIAFGTPDGTVTVGIQTVRVPVDAEALRRVAETTGGRAFEAATAEELRSVFEDLGAGVGVERVEREVTDLIVGAALAFAVAAAIGSLAWFSRLP